MKNTILTIISWGLLVSGFTISTVSCFAGYMTVQGPSYAHKENAIAGLGFLAMILGLILFLFQDSNK